MQKGSATVKATSPQPKLSMVITVEDGSPLEFKKRSEVAKEYGVEIAAVLKPFGSRAIRETGTEIAPGDALEASGPQDKVLELYKAS